MLLLFDIDGTLMLKASREHAQALRLAVAEVHGIPVPTGRVAAAGRTDGAIARSMLLQAGVDARAIDDGAADVFARTVELYGELCPDDLTAFVAPGVPELLAALDERGEDTLALLTGNLEPVARLKLARAGIGGFFAEGQGAFGSDDEDRAALPDVARARAGDHPREDTVVIGDTPLDIACARAGAIDVVAIATGPHPASDLTDADVVVKRAADVAAALDQLRSVQ